MITTEFFNPNISIQISGMSYYTITLAFETFRPALNKGIGFPPFIKTSQNGESKMKF